MEEATGHTTAWTLITCSGKQQSNVLGWPGKVFSNARREAGIDDFDGFRNSLDVDVTKRIAVLDDRNMNHAINESQAFAFLGDPRKLGHQLGKCVGLS